MAKTLGHVIYEGPSLLDGKPIVVLATYGSNNVKTGNIPQVWIMRSDVHPSEAVRTGEDSSICGDCPHRGGKDRKRSCYVRVFHAPRSIWEAYKRGRYQRLEKHEIAQVFKDRFVRLGAYGDPAAAPRWVWEQITSQAEGWTGYTHQWSLGFALAEFVMASVETSAQSNEARAMGYRTFRVTRPGTPREKGVMVCPASAEMGHKLQCHECKACNGVATNRRSHVQIAVHGSTAKHALTVLQ